MSQVISEIDADAGAVPQPDASAPAAEVAGSAELPLLAQVIALETDYPRLIAENQPFTTAVANPAAIATGFPDSVPP